MPSDTRSNGTAQHNEAPNAPAMLARSAQRGDVIEPEASICLAYAPYSVYGVKQCPNPSRLVRLRERRASPAAPLATGVAQLPRSGTPCSNKFRFPGARLLFLRTGPVCGLDAVRIQNRGDQSREAPLDLLAAADVAHFHAVPFAQDQPCFPERPEVL